MALGLAGRQSIRLAMGAWLALVCLVLCVQGTALAAPGDYLGSFGPDGTAATEFDRPAALGVDQATGAVYVGDSETQILYKFDADGNPLNYGGGAPYISGNEITGLELNEGNPGTGEVAVDSTTHVVYVTSGNKVRAFEANGEPHKFTAGPGAGTSEIPGATELYGVTVDASGNIYASDFGDKKVRIYSSEGELITEFKPEKVLPTTGGIIPVRPGTMAVAPDGTLYITDYEFPVIAYEPSRFPVTAKTTYGPGHQVNTGLSTAVTVDPATQYVYIGELCPVSDSCVSHVAVYNELGVFVGAIGAEGPGDLEGHLPAGLGVNGEGGKLYGAIRGGGSFPSQVFVFETLPLPKGPPTILGSNVTNVASSTAVLRARINPNTLETRYWFEYGLEDCATSPGACTKVPSDGASAGNGHLPTAVSAAISGLNPGTKYYFRVVAENSFEPDGLSEGPVRTFMTQAGHFGSDLSDHRVWEQVTPKNKFGGGITNTGPVQAAEDGSGISFQTRGSIVEDPEGNRALEYAAVLARRSDSGWTVSDLVPPHKEATGLGVAPEYKVFSHDLGRAVLEPRDDTELSPESSERAPNLRMNTDPPAYRPLVTSKEGFANVPPGTVFGGEANAGQNPVSFSGADGSLSHIVVSSETPLVSGAAERSLYLWSDGDGSLEPVSELPAAEGGGVVTAQLGSGNITIRHAVSEDGSRVFWAPGNPITSRLNWPALYLRDTVANETVRIDVPEAGVTPSGEPGPAFMAASADGTVVFFTDSQQLTEDASPAGRDLYRCEVGNVGGSLGCTDIEDLSAPLSGSGESGNAKELAVGVSDNGESIYFVAGGVLDTEPNGAAEAAVPGAPNLYLWQKGSGIRFIASLSVEDNPDWGTPPRWTLNAQAARGTATASPNGRYLVFMSEQNLAGVESPDPETGEPIEQAFRYDALEDELVCISCNPSGATESGTEIGEGTAGIGIINPDPKGLWENRKLGATFPEPAEGEPVGFTFYWPRAVLNNGRAYFNSASPLVTGDSNGTWDVYQYEPFSLGDCNSSAGSGMVATTASGCVSLISSGTDSQSSVFMDASDTGDDVFFATFARLSAADVDSVVDVYDARVNGVKAVVEQHTECAGEACQERGAPPGDVAPNSFSFNGAGNVKQKTHKHCKKSQRKVKRKGKVKCVPRKKHGHSGKQGGSR
jgi:hypothetical protein